MRSVGLTMRGAVAVCTGREAEARADLFAAIEAGLRSRSLTSALAVAMLAELEVALGKYAEALPLLQPLLAAFDTIPNTELNTSGHLPNAIEALVVLGRLDEAERFIDVLERNGRERDRAWMLAMAARSRSMLLAARGEVEAAIEQVHRALADFERVPIPQERARAQLLLGQLQRRQRQKRAATNTLNEALQTFEELGSRLWADRARAELARTNVAPGSGLYLTPSEQRVAELAASGLTNRDVAAKLFVSAKTVEANLSQVYRKLGIHSRAELGRLMSR
jgi:ATP/maltotriose-dependent transcriptional regulator MalT